MRKFIILVAALALLAGMGPGAYAQENPLGREVAPFFKDPGKVKEVSYAAWQTAKDEGPRASLLKSAEHLRKATASENMIPAQAAADAFAAWWYNVAAQYWIEIAAQKPGGAESAKSIEPVKVARQDLERALGWDAAAADQAFQEAYRWMKSYK